MRYTQFLTLKRKLAEHSTTASALLHHARHLLHHLLHLFKLLHQTLDLRNIDTGSHRNAALPARIQREGFCLSSGVME